MKPRILILMHYMELGGAESALLGLLQALDPHRAEVDLFIYDHRGALMEQIVGLASNENDNENENNHANRIRLLPQVEAYSMLERPLSEVVRRGYWRVALMRLIGKLEAKITGGAEIVTQPKWASKVLPFINENENLRYKNKNENENEDEDCHSDGSQTSNLKPRTSNLPYDLAISFVTPHYFVLNNVRAKKKVGWIHTDYTKIQVDVTSELKMWERLDNIVSISPDVTRTFLQVFPSLKDKIVEIENILPKALIEEKSSAMLEPCSLARQELDSALFCSAQLNLLSIGRICDQKNFDNIPYMAKALKELFIENADPNENYCPDNLSSSDFHWYIIGPGEHSDIDAKLKELKVDDLVTFLGPRSNPYPYIKACDIYVQPSRYEGKSVTVREAQMLCKPVIITNYPTAKSQIQDGVDGVICGMDNKEIAEAIYNLANDKAKQQSIIEYLKEHDYSGMSEVEKVYGLVDN